MNVLVVDSNPLVRRVVQNCLAPVRYQVLEAADQAAAASLLRHQQIPILLTAWPMPGGDGGDLLQRIRAAPATQYTYVILLADRDDQAALIEGMHAGADDYLVKPLNLKELRRRVMLGGRMHKLESRVQQFQRERDSLLACDPLTGVLNRQSIYTRIEAALGRYERDRESFSLVVLRLDQLATINEQYGYAAGDLALRLVADAVTRTIRQHDAVGRWRGSQFLLVLPATTGQTAAAVAERVRGRVASLAVQGPAGQRARLSVSTGVISSADGVEPDLPALLRQADHALNQAHARRAGIATPLFRAAEARAKDG